MTEAAPLSPPALGEEQLVDNIQPIRGFVLASMIQHFFRTGLYDELDASPGTVDGVAANRDLDSGRLWSLFRFLAVEEVVVLDEDGSVRLAPRAHDLAAVRPWYEMIIGGYGRTFLDVGDKLSAESGPAARDGGLVATGSCGISMHDSLPIVHRLLAVSGREHRHLLDLGCGSGVYLTELVQAHPGMRATGIEPSQAAVDAAQAWIEECELADRVQVACSEPVPFLRSGTVRPDLLLLCFVIHEVLGQEGEPGARALLDAIFENNPDAELIIIDIDHRWADEKDMDRPLAKTYYNGYFLLHPFTSQRLERAAFWDALFASCGLETVSFLTTDPALDSTEFEVGWLLRKRA